jgi:hypothetical protein
MISESANVSCNICGGSTFAHGPGGRRSPTGKWPRCVQCGSLERHRALRRLMRRLPIEALDWRRGLQFSPDVSFRPDWFQSYEVSIYQGPGSLDLHEIARPDGCYDFVTLNMVLEFITDAKKGFRELLRILSPLGLLQIGFADAVGREECIEYPVAQGDHDAGQGYLRLFGRDLGTYFDLERLGASLVALSESDAVTGFRTYFHFFAKDSAELEVLTRTQQPQGSAVPVLQS